MTNSELFELATRSFNLMTQQEQVITLGIFISKINKGNKLLDAFIDATCSVCKVAKHG